MNTERKLFSLLAFIAAGFCLSSAELTVKKIYVLKNDVDNKTVESVRGAVAYGDDNSGDDEVVAEVFAVRPVFWELVRGHYMANHTVAVVDSDYFPLEGFFMLVQIHPEMCSEILPLLLARVAPETVAEKLPGPLTPSHKVHMVRECVDRLHLSSETDYLQN